MPTTSEVLELILKVAGEAEGARLEQQLAAIDARSIQTKEDMDDLEKTFQKGKVTADEYADFVELLTRELQEQDAATAKVAASLEKAAAAQQKAAATAQASAEKAAASQVSSAQRAADAVQAASDKINAAFIREGLSAEAAADKQFQAAARAAQADFAAAEKAEAAANKVAAAAAKPTQAMSDYRQRIQGLGFAINDFTSVSGDMSQRLNAIANNMPMLLAGFGGLGLALSGLLPVIGLVIKNWDYLVETFGFTTAKVKGYIGVLEDRIKELSEKKVILGADLTELEAAKEVLKQIREGIAAYEEARGAKSKAQQESGAAVKGILAEAPGGEKGLVGAIKAGLIQDLEKLDDPLHQARLEIGAATVDLDKMRKAKEEAFATGDAEQMVAAMNDVATAQGRLATAEQAARDARTAISGPKGKAEAVAGDIIKRAQEGDAGAQADLAERLKQAGQGDIAAKIEKSSPAAAADMKQAEAEIEVGKKRAAVQAKMTAAEVAFEEQQRKDHEAAVERQRNVEFGGMGFLPEGGAGGRGGGVGAGAAGLGVGGGIPGVGRIMVGAGQLPPARQFGGPVAGPNVQRPAAALSKRERLAMDRAKRAARVRAAKEAKAKKIRDAAFKRANTPSPSPLEVSPVPRAAAGPKPGESPLVPLGQRQLGLAEKTLNNQAAQGGVIAVMDQKLDRLERFANAVGGQIGAQNKQNNPNAVNGFKRGAP